MSAGGLRLHVLHDHLPNSNRLCLIKGITYLGQDIRQISQQASEKEITVVTLL